MGSRRVLVLVGLIIIAIAIGVGLLFLRRAPAPTTGVPEEATPQTTEILISANNLTRGMEITRDRVQLQPWPIDQLPPAYYTDIEEVLGYIVRVDIAQGMPLMPSMLTPSLEGIGAAGSEAATLLPKGKRAYAIPMDLLGAVAWTVKPGDYVDVLASWYITELDEEFQSLLPNLYMCIGGEAQCSGTYGRLEVLPTGQVIMVYPSQEAEQRYVAQLTIQNVMVLGVGRFEVTPITGETVRPAEGGRGEAEAAQPEATPTPSAPTAQAVILVVDPQDALVLKALVELQADIDLALRPAGDHDIVTTDPVSMEYILTRYGVSLPPKLPYGVIPPAMNPLQQQVESGAEATTRPPQ